MKSIDLKEAASTKTEVPALSFTEPSPLALFRTNATIRGNCLTGIDVDVKGSGIQAPKVVPCVANAFTVVVDFTPGDGIKTVDLSQFKFNIKPLADTRNFIKDNTPPNVQVTGPAVNLITNNQITLVGTCENGYPVNLSGAIAATSPATCASGVFSANVVLSSPDGMKNVVVTQTDGVGLTATANRSFNRDATPPLVSINSPAANASSTLGLSINGSCESGFNVTIGGTGVSAPSTVACTASSFSSNISFSGTDGAKNITVTQTDGAGNIGTNNRSFIKDTVNPVITITAPAANTTWQNSVNLTGTCETGINVNVSGTGAVPAANIPCNAGSFSVAANFSAGDGIKSLTVSQTDLAGNIGSANQNYIRDSQPPVLVFTSPAAGTNLLSSTTVVGTCEAGLPVSLSGAGVSAPTSTTCTGGTFTANITFSANDGNKVVTASQTDAVGNVGTISRTFVRDTTLPVVTFGNPAAGTAAQNGLVTTGTCETGLQVSLSGSGLSTPVNAICNSGSYSAVIAFSNGDGIKSVNISQTDLAGNIGTASRNFLRDTVAPMVGISAPAPNTLVLGFVSLSGFCESGINVVISGTGAAGTTNVSCTAGSFSSNVNITTTDGVKNIVVTQTDSAGNVGTDNRNFFHDATGPVITINTPAPNTTSQSGVTITGNCENGLPITVSGDAGTQVLNCSSGTYSVALVFSGGDSTKSISVSQTDLAMNTNTDSRNFIKDTTAPAIAILAPVADSTVLGTATVTGSCEAGPSVLVNGPGLVNSLNVQCVSNSFSAGVTFTPGDGPKQVFASQTDIAGNTGTANRNFIRDTTAPVIAIQSPVVNTSVQTGLTISGICESGLTVNIAGSGVSGPTSANCLGGNFTTNITFSAGNGVKNVIVSQTDVPGNTSSDNRNFIRDTASPLIAITSPIAGTASSAGLTIGGTCEAGLAVQISGTGVSASTLATCASGSFSSAITFSAGEGAKSVTVSQTDAALNVGTESRNFLRDSIAPLVAITSPSSGVFVMSSTTLTGTCENGLAVNVSGSVANSVTTLCSGGSFSVSIQISSGDGTKNITASQTDAAGNLGSNSRSYSFDSTSPALAFTSPTANTPANSSLGITGTCETGLTVTINGTGVAASSTAPCSAGIFSSSFNFSPGDGLKSVSISQTDLAGNTGSDSRTFIRDTIAPAIAITAPAAGFPTNLSSIVVSGTCEIALPVNLIGAGLAAPLMATCTSGSFSQLIGFSAGDGTKTITASQTDAAGNIGSSSRNLILDTVAPVVSITSPASGATIDGSFVLDGTCETGLSVEISGAGVSSITTTNCVGGSFSSNVIPSSGVGNKVVTVAQTDNAGNNSNVSRTFNAVSFLGHEVFIPNAIGAGPKQIDILVIDDNSAAMEFEQSALAGKFIDLVTPLGSVDWQVGITTTDVSAGPYGVQGSLLPLTGAPGKIIDASTVNAPSIFQSTIERTETIDCVNQGTCPSGVEQPLAAAIMAIDKRGTDNTGFFRPGADLAILILSDEDEMSDAGPTATLAQQVIDHFKTTWPTGKKLSAHAIVIPVGDAACLATQGTQFGATPFYGSYATDFVQKTAGVLGSVCAPDYGLTLTSIGQRLIQLTQSVQLARIPILASVNVVFTPAQAITWTVSGDKVVFDSPPAPGTQVDVFYNY